MLSRTPVDPKSLVGREPERLSLEEHNALAGKWIALEIYDPQRLPLRRIEAVGDTAAECIRHLRARGLEPDRFEFSLVRPPYA
jgi:hypothetical protein